MRLQELANAPLLEHRGIDLDSADRVLYVLEQSFDYEYDRPATGLRHRLMVVPRAVHGAQHRRAHRLEVSGAVAARRSGVDRDGNPFLRIAADRVERSIHFGLTAVIERVRDDRDRLLPASMLGDPRLHASTGLTALDARLIQLARDTVGAVTDPTEQAELLNAATKTAITYEYGRTGVRTTAAEALQIGFGVCQDSAHVFIALCRSLGLGARYVSGHLLGQGGTHAWAEVIVAQAGGAAVIAFDPCNNRRTHSGYVSVAVGRDYRDVAPTSGSFQGPARSSLTTKRRLGVLQVS